jgi:hypothetical protein
MNPLENLIIRAGIAGITLNVETAQRPTTALVQQL